MKFSIITCTRNNSKWLPKHIESVQNQTYKNFEHIIIDDASTDNSIDVLKNSVFTCDTKVYARREQAFAVKNHLFGMKHATGDVIVHLDGDDWFYDNNVLSYLKQQYEEHDCWATYGSWVHFDSTISWHMPPFPSKSAKDIRANKLWSFTHLRSFKKDLISVIPAMDIVDAVGDLHKYSADVVLLTSVYEYALHKNKLLYVKNPLVVYNSNTGFNDHSSAPSGQYNTSMQVFNSPYSILNII
jgi:glycosyltransferase involved in cell wall biosynthesis